MPLYPEQLPMPDVKRCIEQYGCLDQKASSANIFSQLKKKPSIRFRASDKLVISPNPIAYGPMSVTVQINNSAQVTMRIIDILGREYSRSKSDLNKGVNQLWVDVTGLNNGQYFIIIDYPRELLSSSFIINR
jgi:hypothetical protein